MGYKIRHPRSRLNFIMSAGLVLGLMLTSTSNVIAETFTSQVLETLTIRIDTPEDAENFVELIDGLEKEDINYRILSFRMNETYSESATCGCAAGQQCPCNGGSTCKCPQIPTEWEKTKKNKKIADYALLVIIILASVL